MTARRDPRAVALIARQLDVPEDQVLRHPPTLAESSAALRFAFTDLAVAVRAGLPGPALPGPARRLVDRYVGWIRR